MKSNHNKILIDVFSDVTEKLAFMFTEEAEKNEFINNGSHFIQAEITFTGEMAGALSLIVSEEMCSEIATNILGTDPDDKIEKTQSCDALKEVLNVTCGNVLTAFSGDKSTFDLSIPLISEIDVAEWNTLLNEADTIGLLLDDNPVLLYFTIES